MTISSFQRVFPCCSNPLTLIDLVCPSVMVVLFLALIHFSFLHNCLAQCDLSDVNCKNNTVLETPKDDTYVTDFNVTRKGNETIIGNDGLINTTGSPSAKKRKEKRRKTLTWLWILLSVIVLFLIAVIALLFCWKEKKPDEKEGSKGKPEIMKTESKTSDNPASTVASKGTNQPDKAPLQPGTKAPVTEANGGVKTTKVPSEVKVVSKDAPTMKDETNNVDVKKSDAKNSNVKKSLEEVKKPPQNSGTKASSQVPMPHGHN